MKKGLMLLSLCLVLVGCATYNVSEVVNLKKLLKNQRSNGMSTNRKRGILFICIRWWT